MNKQCPFCKKNLLSARHIYACDANENIKNKDDIKYAFLKHNFNEIANKDVLEKEYLTRELSFPEIRNKYSIDYKSIVFLLEYFDIKRRSISESCRKRNEKSKKTVMDKYGVDNVSKSDEIKRKKADTFMKNYGVDNIWKSKDYYEWLDAYMLEVYGTKRTTNPKKISETRNGFSEEKWESIKNKHRQSVEKYRNGKKYWLNLSDEEKSKRLKDSLWKGRTYHSKLEKRIINAFVEMGIPIECQKFIGGKSFDICLFNKFVIEVNGDFWHANPKLYKKDSVLKFPETDILAEDIWNRDEIKKKIAEDNGYIVRYIWEKEVNELTDEELISYLLDFLHKLPIDNNI